MNGEADFTGKLVEYFATWHRANYGGCKGGNADVLIGATAKLTQVLNTTKNSIVRDKLTENQWRVLFRNISARTGYGK